MGKETRKPHVIFFFLKVARSTGPSCKTRIGICADRTLRHRWDCREVSERVYRGTHTHSRNPTHTLYLHQCPVLSGELIPGATPHVVPAGDRTRVGRLATASATTELHARSPVSTSQPVLWHLCEISFFFRERDWAPISLKWSWIYYIGLASNYPF